MQKFLLSLSALLFFSPLAYTQEKNAKMPTTKSEPNPVIRIMTSKGDMKVELYEDQCPNTVANIISLAEAGFYRGHTFHRVIPGFMV